jgi:hypothetical protein
LGSEGFPGGSLQLGELIDQYGEYLVSDFEQFTNYHLNDIYRPGSGLGPTQALLLIKHLPLESATVAQMRGGQQFRGWNEERYLLANAVDLLSTQLYAFVMAHHSRGPKPREPKPIERPGNAVKAKKINPFRANLEAAKKRKAIAHG